MVQSLGGRLKRAREALGYTQSGISEVVGSKLRSWQDYEADKRQPGSQVIRGLAEQGVNTNWLLTGAGEMFAPQTVAESLMKANLAGIEGAAEEREEYAAPFIERVRRTTEVLQQIRDELDYDPGQAWNTTLQEMLVSGQLTESGAYTLITRLRTMGGEN